MPLICNNLPLSTQIFSPLFILAHIKSTVAAIHVIAKHQHENALLNLNNFRKHTSNSYENHNWECERFLHEVISLKHLAYFCVQKHLQN